MYESFNDRARKVFFLANAEAQRLNHDYVATEHMLLGLIKEGNGVAVQALKNLGVNLDKLRSEIEKHIQSGPDVIITAAGPRTPRVKKVIEYAMEEARGLEHNYVGTEHLLLGVLREQESLAAKMLFSLGIKLDEARAEVLRLLGLGL